MSGRFNPFAGQPAAPVASDRPAYDPNQASYYAATGPFAAYGGIDPDPQRTAFDASMAEQSSIYTPEAASRGGYKNYTGKGKARTTVLRKGGGELWEDASLMEWDPAHFRLFVGDLDPALSDDLFAGAFSNTRYPSFVKAKIIRDKHTNKGKGFGFVSYKDPQDFLKAWKEINGTTAPSASSLTPCQARTLAPGPSRSPRRRPA